MECIDLVDRCIHLVIINYILFNLLLYRISLSGLREGLSYIRSQIQLHFYILYRALVSMLYTGSCWMVV